MRCKIVIVAAAGSAFLALAIALLLTPPIEVSKKVTLLAAESLPVPPFGQRLKLTFSVRNAGSKYAFLQVAAVETNGPGGWAADFEAQATNTFRTLGKVDA